MRTRSQSIVLLVSLLAASSFAGTGSLSFRSPADWETQHHSSGGRDFYRVSTRLDRKVEDRALLMFNPTLVPPKPKDIPTFVRDSAESFVREARKRNLVLSTNGYHVHQFSGAHCSGSYAAFEFTSSGGGKQIQVGFAMNVGGQVWNGQFTGPLGAWKQALAVLESVKKND